MATRRASDTFKLNFLFFKIFGLWPAQSIIKFYKYYSFFYLLITLVIYNLLLTLNLFYTPRTIENLIGEVTFFFTEIVVVFKVLTIIFMRKTIIKSLAILDSNMFKGCDETSDKIIEKHSLIYKTWWKYFAFFSNLAFFIAITPPLFAHFFFNGKLMLPICNYYFLNDDFRQKHFAFCFNYQVIGMYGHMMYNVNIDTFISGLMYLAIAQFKTLSHSLRNLNRGRQSSFSSRNIVLDRDDGEQMEQLKHCLKHYDILLQYCSNLQKIFTVTLFFQFGVSSVIICVVLCAFNLVLKTEMYIFLILYLGAITMQIFLPGWLGTRLAHESEEICSAIYQSEWIDSSEPYKANLKLLMERTKRPVVLSGLDLFPLTLNTFTSIIKTAYSLYTLIRSFQE